MKIRRREFITLVDGAAAWPITAHAQQTALPLVGYLSPALRKFPQRRRGSSKAWRKRGTWWARTRGSNIARRRMPLKCRRL
jgi:hypothetical protein